MIDKGQLIREHQVRPTLLSVMARPGLASDTSA
jgi:hypothetical protein